jgi:2-isopropylmalate synthase/UPF0716 protein FxsA
MLYFLVYLFLEVLISVNISSAIGGLMTFFAILISAFIGVSILINFRATLMENIRAVSANAIDLNEFQRLNLFSLLGAIFLIVPGFFTDILGVLMQFGVITSMFVNRYGVKSPSYKPNFENNTNIKKDQSDVIDVEIIDSNNSLK